MILPLLIPLISIIAGGALAISGTALAGIGLSFLVSGAFGLLASAFTTSKGSTGFDSSRTYGWNRVGNIGGQGERIPVLYGEHRITPQCVSLDLVPKDGGVTLRTLYICSQGLCDTTTTEAEWKKRIRINKLAAGDVPGVSAKFLPGSTTQKLPEGFTRTGRPYAKNFKLDAADGQTVSTTHVMAEVASGIKFLFAWPGGIVKIDTTNGSLKTACGGFFLEFKPTNSSVSWMAVKSIDKSTLAAVAASIRQGMAPYVEMSSNPDWKQDAKEDGGATKKEGRFFTAGKTRGAVQRVFEVSFPTSNAAYEFRLTSLQDHDDDNNDTRAPTLTGVIELEVSTTNYEGFAGFALEIPASEYASGGEPEVEVLWRGRMLWDPRVVGSTYDAGPFVWSRNPALVLLDIYLNKQYGRGHRYSTSRIHLDSFKDSANLADAQVTVGVQGGTRESLWELDLVVDAASETRQWVDHICKTCRAVVFASEGLIKIAHDIAQGTVRRHFEADPGKLSTRHNVLAGKDGHPDVKRGRIRQPPNSVTVKFRSREREWAEDTVRILLNSNVGVTVAEVPLELQLYGVVRASQAYREAYYYLHKMNDAATLATIAVSYGDLDLELHDLVTLSYAAFGWNSKQFLVLAPSYVPAEGIGSLVLQEYVGGVYPDGVVFTRTVGPSRWATQYVAPAKSPTVGSGTKSTPPPSATPGAKAPSTSQATVVTSVARGASGGAQAVVVIGHS